MMIDNYRSATLIILLVLIAVTMILSYEVRATYTYSGTSIDISDNVTGIGGIHFNGTYLYVIECEGVSCGTEADIYVFDSDGTFVTNLTNDGVDGWTGLTETGNYLYYEDRTTDYIVKHDKASTRSNVFAITNQISSTFKGITTNGTDFWVVDGSYTANNIAEVSHYSGAGSVLDTVYLNTSYGSCWYYDSIYSQNYTEINRPYGIHYDSSRDSFWIVGSANSGLWEMKSDGTCTYRLNLTSEIPTTDAYWITMNGTDIWVSDYDSGVIYIYEWSNSNPTISSNSTNMTARYDTTINIGAVVSDTDGVLDYVNFTVIAPNGTHVVDNVTGTQSGTTWNSSDIEISAYGTWHWWVNGTDNDGGTVNAEGSFEVTLGTLAVVTEDGDQTWGYSNTKSYSDDFNLTVSNDGNSNNTVTFLLYGDLNDSSICAVAFADDPLTIGYSSSSNESVTFTINGSVSPGDYSGNITVNRTDDGSEVNITVSFSVVYGIANITQTGFTITINETDTDTAEFTISNEGNYDLTSCDFAFSWNTSIISGIESHSWNISSFTVTNATAITGLLSITASQITGTDPAATVNINCSSYTGSEYEEETITGTFQVLGTSGGGGGSSGGSYTENIYQNVTVIGSTAWFEGDGVCDFLVGEPASSEDCQLEFTVESVQFLVIIIIFAGLGYVAIVSWVKKHPKRKEKWMEYF